jgi:6,7-dimethyl-8-ribityllumazine synthase
MKPKEGILSGKGLKIAIVCSRHNKFVTDKLLDGALDSLIRHQVLETDIEVIWVPGAFEIPLIAKKIIKAKKFNAIIALGSVIRGATPHFEYISNEVSKGIAAVGLETGIPVIFGILTTNTIEEAIERVGAKQGNRGFQAGLSCLEIANLINSI